MPASRLGAAHGGKRCSHVRGCWSIAWSNVVGRGRKAQANLLLATETSLCGLQCFPLEPLPHDLLSSAHTLSSGLRIHEILLVC